MAGPSFPLVLADLWRHFLALNRWRGGGGMGVMPLTLHDIAAYERAYGARFVPAELDVFKALDAERLLAAAPDSRAKP